MDLAYNLLMLAVDGAVLAAVWRSRRVAVFLAGVLVAGVAAAFLATLLAGRGFGVFRLAAYGVFVHGTVLLVGSGLLLWRRSRPAAVGLVLLAAVLVGVAIDAFLIEPTWLEVTHLRIASPKIQQPVRIVLLADLQTDRFGPYEREVFDRVMAEQPDVILLGGDYLQVSGPQRQELRDQVNAYLREIGLGARHGAFAVRGNIDGDDWRELFHGLPVKAAGPTRSFNVAGIRLTCLGAGDSFKRRLKLNSRGGGRFHVVLGHAPNYALGRVEADLLLAGHTHGGQVRLPLIGPLWTLSRIPRSWAAGLTELSSGAKLYVSRGIGHERGEAPRLRFLCRPELTVIELVPE